MTRGGKTGPFGIVDVPHWAGDHLAALTGPVITWPRGGPPMVQVNDRRTRGLRLANPDYVSDDERIGGLVGQLTAQ